MQALNVGNLCPSSAANAEIFPPEVVDIFELLALLFEAVDSAKFRISGFLKLPIACSAYAATSQADGDEYLRCFFPPSLVALAATIEVSNFY